MMVIKRRARVFAALAALAFTIGALPEAHAEETWYAISFEQTKIGPTTYNTAYGACWNASTRARVATCAYEQCQEYATNPRNCEPPNSVAYGTFQNRCIVIYYSTWTEVTNYNYFETYNDGGKEAKDRLDQQRLSPDDRILHSLKCDEGR